MTEDKTIKSSKGRCLCQSLEVMKECAGYAPMGIGSLPEICVWLYAWDGTTCLFTATTDEFMGVKI